MKIIVAGGTGFIGNALVPKLIADGHQVVLLRRPSSKSGSPLTAVVETADVDLGKPILSENLQGDAIINLVGIIREYPHKGITFVKSHYLVTKNLVETESGSFCRCPLWELNLMPKQDMSKPNTPQNAAFSNPG
jgi:nucleoside-diphosphate-sugar epimerase